MFKRKLVALLLAVSVGSGAAVGAAAYVDAQRPETVSVQAGECEWASC